jgi:hypothetical protein
LLLLALAGSTAAVADQFKTFGDYVVHYNALNTEMLAPDVARQYGIKRSKNRGLFTISVQKKVLGTTGKPVEASITGYATNLTAQTKPLKARKIVDGTAIYYIGDFRITNRETLDFHFTITPAGEDKSFTLKFRKQFFTN